MNADTERKCAERVSEPPGYWHDHACGRKAKWWVKVNKGTTSQPDYRRRPVCGIHVKRHQKYGEVMGPIKGDGATNESEGER